MAMVGHVTYVHRISMNGNC